MDALLVELLGESLGAVLIFGVLVRFFPLWRV